MVSILMDRIDNLIGTAVVSNGLPSNLIDGLKGDTMVVLKGDYLANPDIGNSCTFANDLPVMLAKLNGAEVVQHTRGCAKLAEQLNPPTKRIQQIISYTYPTDKA